MNETAMRVGVIADDLYEASLRYDSRIMEDAAIRLDALVSHIEWLEEYVENDQMHIREQLSQPSASALLVQAILEGKISVNDEVDTQG